MIAALAGVSAALAVVALISVAMSARERFRRAHALRRDARRLNVQRPTQRPSEGNDAREAGVIRDAERALALAREEARAIVADAEAKAGEVHASAERNALALVNEAHEEARQLVESAELLVATAEQRAARERERAEHIRRDVAVLLRDLLAEAQNGAIGGSPNVAPLARPRAVHEAR